MKKKNAIVVQKARLSDMGASFADDEELSRLCRLLRIASERDTGGTVVQVVRILVEKGKAPVGSSDLSRETGLNRITILHHLKRLEGAGIVEKRNSQYQFAYDNFEDMVEMMRRETARMFEEMEEMAKKIDEDFAMVDQYGEGRRIEIAGRGQANAAQKRKIRRAGD